MKDNNYIYICVKCDVPYCGFYERFVKIPKEAKLRQIWWIAWKTVFNLTSRLEPTVDELDVNLKDWYSDIEFSWDYVSEKDCENKKNIVFVKYIEGII